ncbi:MAG: hypothetical protein N2Z74_04505 [Syntrophales bacterium]|nr:hypothetical protein [Syntrophales bacterium]
MIDMMRKALLMGVGLAVMTTEKLKEAVDELVKKGELSEKEAREVLQELMEKSRQARKEWETKVENMVRNIMNRADIPSRREIEELKARLAKLEEARKPAE